MQGQSQTIARATLPYVRGLSEALDRVCRRHGVATTMRPHLTLKRMLVHPKDKREPEETAGVVYQILCRDCPSVYTGETGRRYGARVKEHKKDVLSVSEKKFTRSQRKESEAEIHPSAITDHVSTVNHTIDWDNVTFPMKEADWTVRGVKESIQIRKTRDHSMNRDGSRHQLPEVYSSLLCTVLPPSGVREH